MSKSVDMKKCVNMTKRVNKTKCKYDKLCKYDKQCKYDKSVNLMTWINMISGNTVRSIFMTKGILQTMTESANVQKCKITATVNFTTNSRILTSEDGKKVSKARPYDQMIFE